jgi:methylmalonyl-CoA mutase N-terminal domain/subunit
VLAALEAGYFHREIAQAAYAYQQAIERGEIDVVGVNRFARKGEGGETRAAEAAGRTVHAAAAEPGASSASEEARPAAGDGQPAHASASGAAPEAAQRARLAAWRASRDGTRAAAALDRLGVAARGMENLMPHIVDAVKAGATLGEIAGRLRSTFGSFRERATF